MPLNRLKLSPQNKKSIKTSAVFLISLLIIFIISRFSFFHPVTQGIESFLVRVGTSINRFIFVRGQSEADWQARALRAEELSGTLAISQTELSDLRSQVQELQNLFNYLSENPSVGHLAKVLARSTNEQGTIKLNLGTDDGIKTGDPVIVEGGHLIGVIESVAADTCIARLNTDDLSLIPAVILGDERTIGLVSGQDGYLLRLDFVTQDNALTPGQIVATSGLDGSLPPGLVIGVIESVTKEERAPFQSAAVRPLFDSQFYWYVFVLDY
jgi:rod shape-determining protein MreC